MEIHVPKFAKEDSSETCVPWETLAASEHEWQSALKDGNTAWNVWCQDVEKFLLDNNHLQQRRAERSLGSAPSVKVSTHHMAPEQGLEERQLRRWLRRLEEARFHANRGSTLPKGLAKRIAKTPNIPEDERNAVNQQYWGAARALASERLQHILRQQRQDKLKAWKEKVATFSGACRWVKQEEVTPQVVQDNAGQTYTSRVLALEALTDYWQNIFGTPETAISFENFQNKFHQDFPPQRPAPNIPKIQCTDLKRAAMKMHKKATGLDGISADVILRLPQRSLMRLAQLLHKFERSGQWPDGLLHWKVCFLPKQRQNGAAATLGNVRPISIGPVIYRMWSSIRLRHLRTFLAETLLEDQAGFLGPDAAASLLQIDLRYTAERFPYAVALDFTKAFDSTDFALCTKLLSHIGIPDRITRLLQYQWQNHKKWLTFGGAVSQKPMVHTLGLLQGDPWSPICMSLILTVMGNMIKRMQPQSRCITYIDDRTILAPTKESLFQTLELWTHLYEVTRLRNNDRKEQLFARTLTAYANLTDQGLPVRSYAQVLGVCIGISPRARTNEEIQQECSILRTAQRIAALPGSHELKATLAASILSTKRVWGELFNGRTPTAKEGLKFCHLVRKAVKGFSHWSGHDSRDLSAILKFGHTSDLCFYASQRFLTAVHKWLLKCPPEEWPQGNEPSLKAVDKCLQRMECQRSEMAYIQLSSGRWDLRTPKEWIPRLAHSFKEHWRRWRFQQWITSDRRDAQLARETGIRYTPNLMNNLRATAKRATGHEIGILTGGVQTDAHRGPPAHFCPDCNNEVVPATTHVLWECPAFTHIRRLCQPRDRFLARMGWNNQGANVALLKQMAQIRQVAAISKRKRSASSVDPHGGAAADAD